MLYRYTLPENFETMTTTDDQHLIPAARRSHLPTTTGGTLQAIDFSGAPVRILGVPRPRMENPAHLHLESQESSDGARSKMYLLNGLARLLGAPDYHHVMWEDLDYSVTIALMARLRDQGYAPSTRNAYLAVIRGTARAAWAMEVMDIECHERIRSIKPVRYHRRKAGRAHNIEVIRLLLQVCDMDPRSLARRDGVMIALMVSTGIRRQECTRIQLKHLNFSTHELRVFGKGNKERVVQIPKSVWTRIEDYLSNVRGYSDGALIVRFWNKRETPVIDTKGMDVSSINRRLDNVRRRAHELLGEEISPHDLRRTFTTNLHKLGLGLRELQVLLGHASMSTTEGYLHDEQDDYRKKAAELSSDLY